MSSQSNIGIIGAGVSGITTAVLLQKAGFDVTIYAKELYSPDSQNSSFASLYPAASIIPHSVYHDELNELFRESQAFFSNLFKTNYPGISQHRHFELFCFEANRPDYLNEMQNYKEFDQIDWMPSHPVFNIKDGWEFDCYFADWKSYFPELMKDFLRNGGSIINKEVNLEKPDKLNHKIIINCSGINSNTIQDEPDHPLVMLGHLIKIEQKIIPTDSNGRIISFNFSPGKEHYSNASGEALDVYFYPRENDIVFGGSRFKGTVDSDNNWVGNNNCDVKFPDQILKINQEILEHTFGFEIDESCKMNYQKGLRYLRNKEDGLKLEQESNSDQYIIHNYGHGGAGVTLSWGCAFRILNMIQKYNSKKSYSLQESIQLLRDKVVLER